MVQESWFCNSCKLSRYNSFPSSYEKTEEASRGGGLICFVSCPSPSLFNLAMAVKVLINSRIILLVNVYLPPRTNKVDIKAQCCTLEDYLLAVQSKYPQGILDSGRQL